MATNPPSSGVELTIDGHVGVITLNSPPANIMTQKVWLGLASCLEQAENNPEVRAVIFVSGLSKPIFSAGNDIMSLYAPKTNYERYATFWKTQTVFLARLYRSPLLTIAAIRGACPAGGTIVAMCCDWRIMANDVPGVMGLNEVALGIPVPHYWMKVMANTIGTRATERVIMHGALLDVAECVKTGMVDQTVSSTDLLASATKFAQDRLKFPDIGRSLSKIQFRNQLSSEWEAQWESEAKEGWKTLTSDATITTLTGVLMSLSKNSKKSKL